jgi:hypothetical protein
MLKFQRLARFMAGKIKKPSKLKTVKKSKDKPLTLEEKLSDAKGRMDKIVKGDDQGYHLR